MLVDFPGAPAPFFLSRPTAIHSCTHPDDIPALLRTIEAAARAGSWVGGCLTYEAAAAFDLPTHAVQDPPLAWFVVFSRMEEIVYPLLPAPVAIALTPEISKARYQDDLAKILDYIGAGDSYQVNHTLSACLPEGLDVAQRFLALHPRQRHPYSCWLNTGTETIASFSPELFLQRNGDRLTTAPIKGTRPRSEDRTEDERLGRELERSEKDRAEHVMIVDMARNDLGRVCRIGTVKPEHLFERRQFSTVHHLETRVSGLLRSGVGLDDIMAALFPAASITGAPKHRTMAIIRELETGPRGHYTGSIGIIRPGGDFTFNVAIRTVVSSRHGGHRLGLGGGIVADSQVEKEWREVADKGRFLNSGPTRPPRLIETFLLDEFGAMPRLEAHLTRLAASARALGHRCDLAAVRHAIEKNVAQWQRRGLKKIVRLLLDLDGSVTISGREFKEPPTGLKVRLARGRVDRFDPLLKHKTERREFFDTTLAEARADGYDEVLWLNNLDHVTEGSIRALLLRVDGRWYAPKVADGLLPSIWRAGEMARLGAEEKTISLGMLLKAEKIWMGNSVQGGVEVLRLDGEAGEGVWPVQPGGSTLE